MFSRTPPATPHLRLLEHHGHLWLQRAAITHPPSLRVDLGDPSATRRCGLVNTFFFYSFAAPDAKFQVAFLFVVGEKKGHNHFFVAVFMRRGTSSQLLYHKPNLLIVRFQGNVEICC